MRNLLSLVLLAVGTAACAQDSDTNEAADKMPEGPAADPFDLSAVAPDVVAALQDSERLGTVSDDVRAATAQDLQISNVFVDQEHNKVTIYRVGGDLPAARTALARVAMQGAQVEVRPALVAASEAMAFVEQLTDDLEAIRSAGVEVTTWGPDPEGGPFRITVDGDAKSARALIAARYPALAARLTVEHMPAPTPTAGRIDDRAPYFGGARAKMPAGGLCTTGWAVKNTHEYLITASHCVPPGDNRMWNGHDVLIGTASTIAETRWDTAFFLADVSPGVYTNALGAASASKSVIGVGSPPDGSMVCLSGSFEGLRCGIQIRGWVRIQFHGTTIDVWNAISTTGAVIVGQGDSGGPAFATASGRPIARGMISAASTTASDVRACPANSESAADRVCSSHAYITDMGTLATQFNLKFSGF
jgi:hypothetical protein